MEASIPTATFFPLAAKSSSSLTSLRSALRAALDEGEEIAKGAGASDIRRAGRIGPQHLLGGTIMGTSVNDSVVNSFGQSHELANLYIAGGGIFPTISSCNPTFTLYALSLRGAEQLATNWGSIAN